MGRSRSRPRPDPFSPDLVGDPSAHNQPTADPRQTDQANLCLIDGKVRQPGGVDDQPSRQAEMQAGQIG
ncbi:hypothetical protein, partial [Pseudonocardia oceani]|uniref:hypothetical protein n=1 Tax=Pseudonocardia oceani TaxID=2792013 RepID=UPI001C49D1DC